MKKLFAMFLALTMTFQLITPAWADAAVEAPEEVTEASEVVEEVEETTEEIPEEETTEVPEETLPEETTEATEEETEVTEPATEELPEEAELIMEEVPEENVALQAEEDTVASGTCGENVTWVLTSDGTLTISGTGAMKKYSSSNTAPWYKNRKDIVNAVVKSGVTDLSDYAFYGCYKLESATLEEGVRTIGYYAFSDCKKLTSVTLSDGLKRIYSSAFSGCSSLTSVTIPEGVTSIGDSAFSGCSGLTSVTILEGVTSIKDRTFYNCSSLTSVTIPEGVTSIGSYAFSGCSGLTSVTIPEGVTSIGSSAFSGCSGLTSVTIPEGVTSIGSASFCDCSGLTSVTIPEGVTSIGGGAFSGCSGLTSVMIPEGVTSIGEGAFYGCSGLTSVTIPEGMTSIGSSTFYGCSGLTSVTIPEGVTSIGSSAFSGCSGLTSVTIPEGVTSIGDQTFCDCSGLTSIAIPDSVTSIGNWAFYNCSKLKDVYYSGTEVDWKNIEIGYNNGYLAKAAVHYGQTHICELTYVEAKAATCTEPGNNAYYYCPICKRAYRDESRAEETTIQAETLPALGHSMEAVPEKAATCTQDGNNAYYFCKTCRKAFLDELGQTATTVEAETRKAYGHTMRMVDAVAPTCTGNGNRAYYLCETCHQAFKDLAGMEPTLPESEALAALGHTIARVDSTVSTCTKPGNKTYYACTVCGKAFKDQNGTEATTVEAETLPTLPHSMVKTPAVEPTHTSGGNNAYYTCSVCHKVFRDIDDQTETTVDAEQLPRLPGLAHGTSGSLTWFLSEEAVLTVSGAGRMPDYSGNDLAPWYAFRGKIQKVVLEEGVQTVGSYAFFDCNMLTDVELPQSVTKLGKSCFDGCGQLKLLSLEKVPAELTQKVTDLNGLATLAEPIGRLVGNRAAYHWSLETVRGENQASDLAKLDGTKLEVIHSGKFYLVCEEDYTGLSAAIEVGAKTATEIRPLETEQLASGESLTLSAWAMPFDTRLSAKWTLDQESEAYASISSDGTLTAKAVTAPVQITVKAQPVNGEAAAEKTLWILPKTTGLGILADGHLAGETLTVDLTETRELTLSAQIQPQGAGTKVTWTSSREDVAVIDETGKVILLKPGKTLIRAETQDGSGIATELTLTVRYLDSAETLTLTAQIPETGLEPGMTAKLTLSGENTIDAQNVTFYIPENQAAVAAIDETGTLTAGSTPGTVTVTAALKDDPLMRQAQLTVTVNPMLNHALRLESDIPEGLGYVDGSTFYGEIAGIAGQNRSFALKVQGQDYLGSWAEAKNVTYASSNPAIAAVDASGTVSLTAKEEGICQITVRCTDALEAEAQLTIVLQNSAPRLGATTVTLNSNSTQGADVDLVASYGNTVDTVTVYDYNKSTKTYALSTMFTAEAEEGTLTLYSQNVLKNGTYPVKLEVACRTGVYTFTMNVKVSNTTPKVTVKQTEKLNLFYKNSTAPLTVTAPGQAITDVVLTDTDDFTLMSNGEDWEIVYISENAKPDTKGTLNVYLEGYQAPVQVNLTVGTVTTAPAVKLSAASSTLNTALNRNLTTRVTLLDKSGQPLEVENPTVDCSSADVKVDGSLLTITLNEAKSTTVTLYLQDSTWAQSLKLTHKVTVSEKLPTLKPAGNLTLNSLFAKGTAETGLILSQNNLSIVDVAVVPAAKEGTPALTESEKLKVAYDPETGRMTAQIADASIKAGTYSFNCTGTLEDGTQIPGGTLKVTVSAAAPKVKLSATSVKLNKYLAGEEQGPVTVTAPNGYQVVDFTGKSEGMTFDEDTGTLTVTLENASDNGGSYTLYPVVRDVETGEEVELPTKLPFKVQTYNSQKLSVSLSAKGKLDTQTDSEILYTVTKLTGCLGTVDNVTLEGQDKDLFRAEMDVVNGKPTVHLTLVDGVTYATNKAYKIQFRFYACGTEILSPVQTVKVTQTALKVTAPKNITYYQAQKSPLRVVLTSNVPLDEVTLNNKTAKEFQAAVGEVTLNGNRVEFEIANPAALTAGKSYTVALDATPENNAENAKPVTVRLTVKVQK